MFRLVFEDKRDPGNWYFHDAEWKERGPFTSKEAAEKVLAELTEQEKAKQAKPSGGLWDE